MTDVVKKCEKTCFAPSEAYKPVHAPRIQPPDMLIFVCFGLAGSLMLCLGYAEKRAAERDETHEEARPYSLAAVAVFVIQALLSIVLFGGSVLFPLAAVYLAFIILVHHAIIHYNSKFEGETCSCAPFQLKDVCNHETWVVASLVAAVVSFARL